MPKIKSSRKTHFDQGQFSSRSYLSAQESYYALEHWRKPFWISQFTLHFLKQALWVCKDNGMCYLAFTSRDGQAESTCDCFHFHCQAWSCELTRALSSWIRPYVTYGVDWALNSSLTYFRLRGWLLHLALQWNPYSLVTRDRASCIYIKRLWLAVFFSKS